MDSEWAMMFGTPIVSNTYNNGKGVLLFENDLIKIGQFSITGDNLESIIIPSKVNIIEMFDTDPPFNTCSNLASITVIDNNNTYDSRENCNAIIETASNTLTVGCKNTIIPNSVTSIGFCAFGGCTGLTSITIPNGVKEIGGRAFISCTGLTSITIPNSVTSIGGAAFRFCYSLTSITFEGTMKEWNNVSIENWYSDVPATYVQCTDGQVKL